jgi:hypothetical protein
MLACHHQPPLSKLHGFASGGFSILADSKSRWVHPQCGFDSHLRHHLMSCAPDGYKDFILWSDMLATSHGIIHPARNGFLGPHTQFCHNMGAVNCCRLFPFVASL